MPLPTRTYDRTLNSELERLQYQVHVVRQEAEGLLHGLSDAQLNWSPRPGAWSIAQCMDHLNVTNAKMIQEIEKSIKHGKEAGIKGDGPFVYGFLGRWFRKILEPPVKMKVKAPGAFQPSPRRSMDEIVPVWNKTHDRIEELILSANGLDLSRVRVQSAASSLMKFQLGMSFWIQSAHDRRHLWQIRQVRNDSSFPAS